MQKATERTPEICELCCMYVTSQFFKKEMLYKKKKGRKGERKALGSACFQHGTGKWNKMRTCWTFVAVERIVKRHGSKTLGRRPSSVQ